MSKTTRPRRGEGVGARPGRAATPATHPSTPVGEYERGAPVRLVLEAGREAPVTAGLIEVLREVLAEVEAGRVTTKLCSRIGVAGKLAYELSAARLKFVEVPEQNP